jgi:hypothetical protein
VAFGLKMGNSLTMSSIFLSTYMPSCLTISIPRVIIITSLAKKLKKKIEDLCGLTSLGWEDRQDKANQILSSNEWKQRLCNELIGLSFRELEKVLIGIANERQKRVENDQTEDGETARKRGHSGKSLRRDPIGTATDKPPSRRTLAEILAQVYAPRQDANHISQFERSTLRARPSVCEEILPNSADGDDCTE